MHLFIVILLITRFFHNKAVYNKAVYNKAVYNKADIKNHSQAAAACE